MHLVLPGYFEAMGTRVVAGRVYPEADNRNDYFGIVVDDLLARTAFPGPMGSTPTTAVPPRGCCDGLLRRAGGVTRCHPARSEGANLQG